MRALIVDDDPIYRSLLSMILKGMEGIGEVREATSAAEAIELTHKFAPEFCAIDWMLGDSEGISLGTEILRLCPNIKMTLVTAFPTKELPRDLMRAGFSGYVDKTASVDRVREAFAEVMAGGMFFASTVAPQTKPVADRNVESNSAISVSPEHLTPREREIVVLVATGKMSKEIAYDLNLSPRTVDKHRANILRKLNLHDVASVTRWCLRVGLLDE